MDSYHGQLKKKKKFGRQVISAQEAMMMLQGNTKKNLIAKVLAIIKWFETYRYHPTCMTSLKFYLLNPTFHALMQHELLSHGKDFVVVN
uniref:Uncharacterized protein n=1 Tax=Onchocerca volvulus TaxID=6282 RepID=A0A8R1TUC3_ONCVO